MIVALALGTVVLGTSAYHFVEGWTLLESFYMVVITLSTVGFSEVRPLSSAGEIITIIVIVFGLLTISLIIGQASRAVLEGELLRVMGKRRMRREIERLRDHHIVCGYGRVGRVVCRELAASGVPFLVIDKSEETAARAEEAGILVLLGDAVEEKMLEAARIAHARSLILALPDEAENVYVTLLAKQQYPDLFVLARGISDNCERRLTAAGADRVVSPNILGGLRIANSVLRPSMIEFIDILIGQRELDLQLAEVTIASDSTLAGRTLAECAIREKFGALVVAIRTANGDVVFNPSSRDSIEAGMTLIVMGRPEQLESFGAVV